MPNPMKWTDEQESAINFPADSAACVSAAAGSGKTALLVERVVRLIRGDAENGIPPVSADKFAIMTFTRNAADEFRTRMTRAIDEASRSSGENAIPREQLIKFRSSAVNTINSFCLSVLRDNAELFGLPVNFSIVEESKGKIMQQSALDSAMEFLYSAEFEEQFPEYFKSHGGCAEDDMLPTLGKMAREQLLKSFSYSRDDALREAVNDVYMKTTSLADCSGWLDGCVRAFGSVQSLEERFLPDIVGVLRRKCVVFNAMISRYSTIIAGADEEYAWKFDEVFEKDNELVNAVIDAFNAAFPEDVQPRIADFEKFRRSVPEFSFAAFSRKGTPKNDPFYAELKASVDVVRKKLKSDLPGFMSSCDYSEDSINAIRLEQQTAVCALVMTVERMTSEYSGLKRKAGVVDFSDCERFLYEKLRDENCTLRQTLSDRWQCIIIDEFQDTNDLQFEIFRLISRDEKNLFFVGDVKQAIYAFRGGNPEIMANCCADGSGYETLPLNRNFRSRKSVITAVNAMFDGLMTRKYGEVDYSDGNQLAAGAKYPENSANADYSAEIYLLDLPKREKPSADDVDDNSDEITLEATNPVAEARFTAALIRKMAVEQFPVRKDADSVRPCSWGDFAILLRNKTHIADYKSELEKLGIPVSSDGGNYLSADEINLILSFLKVIDNPQLDEELLTVLMSPLYGLTAEELSLARLGILGYDIEKLDGSGIPLGALYDSFTGQSLFCCAACAGGSELAQPVLSVRAAAVVGKLTELGITRTPDVKCRKFTDDLADFRSFAANNSIERLIRRIYDCTDFFSVISTYERGDRKLANIRLLLKYTADFESAGGGTLNDFLRYTDAVHENSGRLEEAVVPQEAVDAVKIMTFHASKGLEMPVVVMAGLGSSIHEEKSSIVIDRRTGIGLKHTDIEKRLRTPNISFNGANASLSCTQYGEELRLLYVAMTRAREKLVMIGQCTEKEAAECRTDAFTPEFALSQKSYLRMILSSMMRYGSGEPTAANPVCYDDADIRIAVSNERLPEPEELAAELPEEGSADLETAELISRNLAEKYSFEYETTLHSRFSITELAHIGEVKPEDAETQLTKPVFLTPDKAGGVRVNGLLVGNTFHHIMELFPLETLRPDYAEPDMYAAVENAIECLIDERRLKPEECYLLENGKLPDIAQKITAFFCGGLGQDMLTADRVEREYELFAEIPAREVFPEASGSTMIQGRVDMLFVKDNSVVVVDYKTDSAGNLEKELPFYEKQLVLYKKILPMLMTECRNGEVRLALYSFSRQKAIYL